MKKLLPVLLTATLIIPAAIAQSIKSTSNSIRPISTGKSKPSKPDNTIDGRINRQNSEAAKAITFFDSNLDEQNKKQIILNVARNKWFSVPNPETSGYVKNMGSDGWYLVKENQPVKPSKNDKASVLPLNSKASDFSGWKTAKHEIPFDVADGMGGIVSLRVLIKYRYDGSKKGKGKYLSDIAIEPVRLDIDSPVKYSAFVDTRSVAAGTDQENAVADMRLVFKFVVDASPAYGFETYHMVDLKGDGYFYDNGFVIQP